MNILVHFSAALLPLCASAFNRSLRKFIQEGRRAASFGGYRALYRRRPRGGGAVARVSALGELRAVVDARKPDGAERGLANGSPDRTDGIAARDARTGYGLRAGDQLDLPGARVRGAGLGDRSVDRGERQLEACAGSGLDGQRLPDPRRGPCAALRRWLLRCGRERRRLSLLRDRQSLSALFRAFRAGGQIGIVVAGLREEFSGELPPHLVPYWHADFWSFHSPAWWRTHWERTGLVTTEVADLVPRGWEHWLRWLEVAAAHGYRSDEQEAAMVRLDAGRNLGFTRLIARKVEG